ncbi:MAG: hypothetical protein H6Q99_4154, partial [Proteobacteria bacterium]|nr:hypothetical protein [Pseudomonadota bacterium]
MSSSERSRYPVDMDRITMVRARALAIRRSAFTMVHDAGLGHPGGDF